MDADTEPGRSRLGGFLRGALLAAAVCAAAAVAVSLTAPLPGDLPASGRVEVVGAPVAGEAETAPAATGPEAPADTATAPMATDAATAPPANLSADPAASAAAPDGSATAPAGEPPAGGAGQQDGAIAGAAEPALPAAPGSAAGGPDVAAEPPAAAPTEEPAGSAAAGADTPGPAPETDPAPPPSGALAENARAFEAPPETPLMAVVLVGEDVGALTDERLGLLTMPLTVAIPPDSPRAAEIGRAARAAGHEVLADLSLAEGAGAAPAAEGQAVLAMAVGATATAGAADPDALAPALAELGRRGLAWIDTGAGFGTPAERIARELGMAYTQGSRTIDGEGDPDQIYRAIDSAAHQARQWGTSVLFLDAGEPALQALVRWGLEQRSDSPVWFAPVSAVIARRSRP